MFARFAERRARRGLALAVSIAALVSALAASSVAIAGVNAWTTGGPEGALVAAVAIDPETAGVLYAGTLRGHVFKSTSGGNIWTRADIGFTDSRPVRALAIDPLTPTTLFAGTDGALFKSVNGGAIWSLSNAGIENSDVNALAIDPLTPATIYAGLNNGVFKSTDGGASWSASGLPGTVVGTVFAVAIDPVTPATLYAGGTRGLFKSIDGGVTWTARSVTDTVFALAINPQTPTIVYALAGAVPQGGVLKSVNGGATWSPSNAGIPVGFSLLALAIDRGTPAVLYTSGGSRAQGTTFKSVDGGGSWVPTNLPENVTVNVLAVDPRAGSTVLAGSTSGIFKTSDRGDRWNARNVGIADQSMTALALDPQTPAIVYAGTDGSSVMKTADGGGTWGRSSSGLPPSDRITVLAIDPHTPARLYAGTFFNGLFKSADGGGSWNASNSGLPPFEEIRALAVDPLTPTTLYAGAVISGVFKSIDAGATWKASNTGLNTGLSDPGVLALAINPQTPSTLYAGTFVGGISRSTNGGMSWTAINSGFPALPIVVALAIAIDPQTPTTLYASVGASETFLPSSLIPWHVFKSTNGGASWTLSDTGLAGQIVERLLVDPRDSTRLYAGTQAGGVFTGANGGATWTPMNEGLGAVRVRALTINPSGTCLHAATSGGVFDFATQPDASCAAPPLLVASVLPASRSVAVGTAATAFATIVNAGAGSSGTGAITGITCGITQLTGLPTPFTFQVTDPTTNQPTGTPNTPVNVVAGRPQSFVIALTPTAAFCSTDVTFGFNCTNVANAVTIGGVNTLLLTASLTVVPDVIALAATPTNDGIITLPGSAGVAAFAVAAANVGASGVITASADTGDAQVPVVLLICETDPANGQCKAPLAPSVTRRMEASETPTFTVVVVGAGPVPFDPANTRVFVRFKEDATCAGLSAVVTRGSTSVAVRTQ